MGCYIIAEIGVNHSGSVELAKKMIDAAKKTGADAVKFQTFSAEKLVSIGTPKVRYQESTTDEGESHYQMIKSLEFSFEDHIPVFNYCKEIGIDFISTPYDVESAEFLVSIGVEIFKTASADVVDLELQRFLASTGKRVIIATGMATLGEIEEVYSIYSEQGASENISLLHCVSNYPCAHESLNLKGLLTLKNAFGVDVGFSDHSIDSIGAVVAVALGATIVEKHFTLDKAMEGPDHKASSNPDEFSLLVQNIRTTEKTLGVGIKVPQEEELQMRSVSRKSLFLSNDVSRGNTISSEDLCSKRPGTGLYNKYRANIEGCTAVKDLKAGSMISFGDFE